MTADIALEPGRRPTRVVNRVLNPLFRALLRSPLHRPLSGRLGLLTYTGRRSGWRYTIPVGYAREDDRIILLSTESGWKASLRGGTRVDVWLRGRRHGGTAEILDDEAGLAASFAALLARVPDMGSIVSARTTVLAAARSQREPGSRCSERPFARRARTPSVSA